MPALFLTAFLHLHQGCRGDGPDRGFHYFLLDRKLMSLLLSLSHGHGPNSSQTEGLTAVRLVMYFCTCTCTCRYLAVSESEHLTGMDPLQWWSVNGTNYPIISVLAKKYLAIPASSASSERVFSMHGQKHNRQKKVAPASRKTSQDHFFTPQSLLVEIALFLNVIVE